MSSTSFPRLLPDKDLVPFLPRLPLSTFIIIFRMTKMVTNLFLHPIRFIFSLYYLNGPIPGDAAADDDDYMRTGSTKYNKRWNTILSVVFDQTKTIFGDDDDRGAAIPGSKIETPSWPGLHISQSTNTLCISCFLIWIFGMPNQRTLRWCCWRVCILTIDWDRGSHVRVRVIIIKWDEMGRRIVGPIDI